MDRLSASARGSIGDRLDDSRLTEMLQQWSDGDSQMVDRVVPLLYQELRRIAARELRRQQPSQTLEVTALVNEAYLRLRDAHGLKWENQSQFLSFATRLMRHILVDHARSNKSSAKGGPLIHLSNVDDLETSRQPDLVALDQALSELSKIDERKAAIVELRFFGGLTIEETAAVLKTSPETITRAWRRAKAWLYQALNEEGFTHKTGEYDDPVEGPLLRGKEIETLYGELHELMERSRDEPDLEANIDSRLSRLRALQKEEATELLKVAEAKLHLRPGEGWRALREARQLLSREAQQSLSRDEDSATSDAPARP